MTKKLQAAIIGPGLLLRERAGTDLLMKMKRSEWVEPVWPVVYSTAGIDPESVDQTRH